VIDYDKSRDIYTVKVNGKNDEESVLIKSGNLTNIDSKKAIQAKKKGQFNTLEKAFAKKTGQQTEERGPATKTKRDIFAPVVKEEHKMNRTEDDINDDINDDDEVDKYEQQKAARQRNKAATGSKFLLRSMNSSPQTVLPCQAQVRHGISFSFKKERKNLRDKSRRRKIDRRK